MHEWFNYTSTDILIFKKHGYRFYFVLKRQDRVYLYKLLHYFGKLTLTGWCLVTRKIRGLRSVVTAIFYRRINHGSFPYMCMSESHITVLEYVITNEDWQGSLATTEINPLYICVKYIAWQVKTFRVTGCPMVFSLLSPLLYFSFRVFFLFSLTCLSFMLVPIICLCPRKLFM